MNNLLKSFPTLNYDYNPKLRDEFVKSKAILLPNKSKVLDVSAGTKPYKDFFSHCIYHSHEFKGNHTIDDTFRREDVSNKQHDFYSEIQNIPVENDSYDFILCTEVFEHIPEPINAMQELIRICKPNGKILITAPFTSGIHQEPYHFYSGFSPFFYNYLKEKFNLKISDFKSQGNLFLLQNQEIKRCLSFTHPRIVSSRENLNTFQQIKLFLHNYTLHLFKLSENNFNQYDKNNMLTSCGDINQFSIGYCVLYEK